MILTCPACSTRYLTDAGSFTPHGRTVRCAKCGHSWFQNPPGEDSRSGSLPAIVPEGQAAPPVPVRPQQAYATVAVPGAVAPPRPLPRNAVDPVRRPPSSVPVVIFLALGVFALLAALYQYRVEVAAMAPEMRGVYDTLGIAVGEQTLEFRNVDFRWADPEMRTRLDVWGEVVNVGKASQAIPLLRFSMSDEHGIELYARTLTLQQRHLAPGASNSFAVALDNPPLNAIDITVDFVKAEP